MKMEMEMEMEIRKMDEINEIQVSWNKAALQMLINDVEFLVNSTIMVADTVVNQQKKVLEFQQHFWEIL